jgi:hypothetical protein
MNTGFFSFLSKELLKQRTVQRVLTTIDSLLNINFLHLRLKKTQDFLL